MSRSLPHDLIPVQSIAGGVGSLRQYAGMAFLKWLRSLRRNSLWSSLTSSAGYERPSAEASFYDRCKPATSTDRCNTSVKSFCRGFEPQRLALPLVELTHHFIQMRL
jgi:hypothetical protein